MLKTIGLIVLALVLLLGAGTYWYVNTPKFGYDPAGESLARVQKSPYYKDGAFHTLEPAEVMNEDIPEDQKENFFTSMKKWILDDNSSLFPSKELPHVKTDLKALPREENIIVWMGHSSFYMQIDGVRILVDPVLSGYASPIPLSNFKEFAGADIYKAENLPDVDVLLISHNHWDHLDYDVMQSIKGKVKEVIVPLGLATTMEKWGFKPEQIHELDWYEDIQLPNNLTIHALPAQHFSGRFLKRNATLWGAWAFVTPQHKVFYSGDGGYHKHFKEYGEKFGGFDLAIMEDGQYNVRWAKIHSMPEEVIQEALDIKAKAVIPVHNSKFVLARHTWNDPLARVDAASDGKGFELWTPMIGQPVDWTKANQHFDKWWEK